MAAHDEIEGLLETHLFDIDSMEAKLSHLSNILQNAEASVSTDTPITVESIE